MEASQMKLIAYGKVMDAPEKTLKDYAIKENDFLVVMISKVSLQEINQLLGKTCTQTSRRRQNGRIASSTCRIATSSTRRASGRGSEFAALGRGGG